MDEDRILERERYQIQQIRELDSEELLIEEVEGLDDSSDEDQINDLGNGGASASSEFTFNPYLASLHTYLGEVEDTHHRLAFVDAGAILKVPLFYLEGVVLFPEATLPLRVIQPNFVAAVEKALTQADAPYTIGVVRVSRDTGNGRIRFATIGTTAEIRKFRRLEDGSLNLLTRGQQRFHLRRRWIDMDGAPCGEIQIIQEDLPLRTPRDAVGRLAPLRNLLISNNSHPKQRSHRDEDDDSDAMSEESFESELSLAEKRLHQSALVSCYGSESGDESTSSDDEKSVYNTPPGSLDSLNEQRSESNCRRLGKELISEGKSCRGFGWKKDSVNRLREVPRTYCPHWVYPMYDSYCLAQRVADMWRQIVGTPSMEVLVRKPDLLSFHIASKIPVSESTRQELLEIDGISYRLRREIELLESFDRVRCKICQTVIGKRSDMLVMSNEGPLGAYVNPHGYVHEVMTLYKAVGLALIGSPVTEDSWFPGYAWTIVYCATCECQMGWRFTATNRKLKPRSFWAIRSSQVADETH
ncbi:hypothetical protein LguiA_036338 [Lonicera macranthoides]